MISYLYKILFALALGIMLSCCSDQELQEMNSGTEQRPDTPTLMKVGRSYSSITITSKELAGLDGYKLLKKGDFFYLSDSLVHRGLDLFIDVEQNPFDEERTGTIEVIDEAGITVKSIQIIQAQSSSQSQADAYCGALQRSYGAGYGYNGFGGYAAYNEIRDQVISLPALQELERKLHTSLMVDDFRPDTKTTILEGNDSETLLRALSMYAGISADLLIMQGEVKMSYASSDLKRNAYSFCTIFNNYTLASRHIDPYTLRELSYTYPEVFSAGFRYLVRRIGDEVRKGNLTQANQLIEEMYSLFGTHFIYYAELGGRLTYTSTFERAALNSQTTLSKAAEASFLNMCGFKSEESQKNTYSQVSERHSRKLVACGGDVRLTSQILNNNDDQLDTGIINQWYESIRFEQNNPENSNVELIGVRLFPIYLLVTDTDAQKYIEAYYGMEEQREYEMFPRNYSPTYSTLRSEDFTAFGTNRPHTVYTYSAGEEVIGEMMNEQINGKTYISFYPVIEGEVTTESLSLLDGKEWYRIWWKSPTECVITPSGTTEEYSEIYYNNGFLSTSKLEDKEYGKASNTTFKQFTWQGWVENFWKIGPFLLMQAPEANFGKSNQYEEEYFKTVVKDCPHGFAQVNLETAKNIDQTISMFNYRDQDLWNLSPFIIFNHYDDSNGHRWEINYRYAPISLNPSGSKNKYRGRLIYHRTSSFRYP